MQERDLTNIPDPQVLREIHTSVGVLEERTKGLPAFTERVIKTENDVRWLKRIVWSLLPAGGIIGTIIVAAFRLTR